MTTPQRETDSATQATRVPGDNSAGSVCGVQHNNVSVVRVNERTFTSTEAQTEESAGGRGPGAGAGAGAAPRRQQRPHRPHRPLPDLVDTHHLPPPPPYTQPPPPPPPIPLPFQILPSRRRASVYREVPKSCCGLLSPAALPIRWLMLLLLTVGVCCALVGTVLGATRATAPHHLTVALLMIGVGIVLVTVSGVGWRLMSQEGGVGGGGGVASCRAILGLVTSSSGQPSNEFQEVNRRFLPRLPPSYGRPHHPYAAMMYPEFQYRAPPPSYQASMQEYRLRLLLLDRHNTPSPPPTYRSHPSTLLRGGLGLGRRDLCSPPEYSRPPSYRSRTSTELGVGTNQHSRQVSNTSQVLGVGVGTVTVSQHQQEQEAAEEVGSGVGGAKDQQIGQHHQATALPLKENTVTIVQSAEEPTGPVIVTISGPDTLHHHAPSRNSHDQMEILAHL